jgi:hypothetical protein
MATRTLELSPANPRLPLAMGAATLVAIASHYVNGESFRGMILFAALVAASYFTRLRLPRNRALIWTVRAVLYAVVLTIVGLPKEEVTYWYIRFEYTDRIGYLLAAELALRAWRAPDATRVTRDRGDVLLLSALLMTASANTYDRGPMQWLAPLYTFFLLLSLRTLHPPRQRDAVPARPPLGFAVARFAAVVLALLLGFTSIYLITRYDRMITRWAVSMLRDASSRQSEIGLSSAPRLQTVFNPKPSMTRMLLIDGPPGERHLRAMAFDTYDGSRWKPELQEREFKPVPPAQLQTSVGGVRLKVTRLGDTMDLLLLPLETSAVTSPAPLERDALGALRTIEAPASYAYESTVPGRPSAGSPLNIAPEGPQRERLLAVPPDVDAKVVSLAREVAGEGDAATRLARLQLHLRSKHQYSLSFEPQGEPLSDFVLNGRSAHCQYFASALVMMARANGIPARFVTGYYAHEPYGDNRTVVRDRDAHAWAECWVDASGWVTVDATPSSGRPDELFPEPSGWQKFWERAKDLPTDARQWLASLERATVIRGVAAVAGLVVVVALIRHLRRRRGRPKDWPLAYDPPAPDLLAAGRRFERLLKRHSIPCPPNRTWREHVRSADERAIDVQACLRFVDTYERARFGGSNGQAAERLGEALASIERQPR